MTVWLALLSWALTAGVLHLRGRRRLVRVARAGHEVRGPLCTAQLALEGLERTARVEAIGLELRRAALALDDLSGPRRPRLAVARVDVGRLLSDASHAWHALAEAHGAMLAVEPGCARVSGDPLRLVQACANLVANAIEHGASESRPFVPDAAGAAGSRSFVPDGAGAAGSRSFVPDGAGAAGSRRFDAADLAPGEPRLVHVRSSTREGRVRIEVRDNGPGLPAPVAELVAAARGRTSPRGHGLAIAAAVAERHGGRLASLPAARGACLVLELPEAP